MEINGTNFRYIAKTRKNVLVAAAHSADKLTEAIERDGFVLAERINDGDMHHKAFFVESAKR